MAKLSHTDSRRMYSWWWDSHISPKNSKWLQENLTDMDVKVKSMIKLIEEDADSFARRAEMYYKKRPELMKLVEEFYRAYRALAERYDHATGVIRHAHHTMAEAFPNQVPMMFSDDSPATGTDPRTPEATSIGEFTDECVSGPRRKPLKQFKDPFGQVEHVRRGLNFDEAEEEDHSNGNNHDENLKLSKSDNGSDSEEILALKEAIAKLEVEKEAGLVQYQQSLDKLSQLETEMSKTREHFEVLSDHAKNAENEVVVLKEALSNVEAEKESKLQEYQQRVDQISNLQTIISTAQQDAEKLNERANIAEIEAESLKSELDKLSIGKDAALNQYMQSLEMISNMENKLQLTEEDAKRLKERAEKAECEVEILRQTISKLTEEKEAAAQQYQECLETISLVEHKLKCADDEAKQLSVEIVNGVSKLKGAEEQCLLLERSNQSLHSELESLMLKMGTQTQELTEKQKELGRLWACIQEERLRFVEAETAFQTLQHLHAQTQEELRAMASELQNRAQLLKVSETQNQSLQEEVLKVKEENKHLDELNASSALSIKDMQNEISSLMESKGKLEEEVELRLDQRNALQQEIYCLKEELNDLNKKHLWVLDKVHAVGLNPESLESSVKELQDENSRLKETCERESNEKAALLQKLEILEQLLEKNALLETSLSDLNAELEAVRGKIEALERSCESLLKEKSTLLDEKANLVAQLQETNKNLEKLSENNTVLENSLSDAHHQLEALKAKSKILEDSCQLLVNEKAGLKSENDGLTSQLENTRIRLEDLGKLYGELEGRRMTLEKEKELTIRKVEEMRMSLELEKKEHANYVQTSETRLSGIQAEMHFLQEECQRRNIELDQALDNAINNEIEIFVLRTTNKNLEKLSENNTVLENSLSDAHHQLEALKAKSKILEDSCQLLVNEKAGLKSENDGLTSQLENTRIRLEDLGKLYGELEGRRMTLEKEKELTIRKVEEMRMSLELEKKEHANYVQTSETRLSGIQAEMHFLQEECQRRNIELDQVLDKAMNNEIEIFVLRTTAQELKENNCLLVIKNQKLLEESRLAERKISQLEQTNFKQQVEIKSLSDQTSGLRAGTCQLMKLLDIVEDCERGDKAEQDQVYINQLLCKLQNMKTSLREAEEENMEWAVELSVLLTWIRQLRRDSQNLELEKDKVEHESKLRTEQVLKLQTEVLALLELNEELRSKLREGECNKQALQTQIEDLNKKLMDTQGTCQVLQREKLEISEEKRSLMDNILHLEEKKDDLEEENNVLCGKVLALENLSLIFRSFADEKLMVLKKLEEDHNKLNVMNAALLGKLSSTEGRLEESKIENLHLEESLQKTEDEFKIVATVKDQLSNEIENGKKLLHKIALELQEAEEKISLVEREKLELNKSVDDLRMEHDDVKMARDHQENQIFKLSAENDHLSKENNCLHEAIQTLEVELSELQDEHNKRNIEEENLHFELQKKTNEINELEARAASDFGQLQNSMVSQLLYEQKFYELYDACLGYIDQNEGLKTQLAAFGPEIVSLKECISSLENHTDVHIKFQNPESEELQGAQVANDAHESILNKDMHTSMPSELRDLRVRLQAIVKAAVETKELMVQENMNLHSKLEASMKQLELLQSDSGRHRRNRRSTSEITEADNPLLTKDIMLDQVSDGSSYGYSKREPVVDNQIEELWETADPDGTVGLNIGKSKKIVSPSAIENTKFHRVKSVKKQNRSQNLDATIDKELSIDKLEISKRSTESLQEGNKRKVLERLDSDVQKLANLQITVQDLKRKLDVIEKGKRGKAVVECEALKGQLEEADIAILKLFDLNGRLMKTIDDRSLSDIKSSDMRSFSDLKSSSFDLEGDGNARRRRVSEQARRMSEKIGRLQLEVQKLQFVLLKLDDEKEGKSKMSEAKRRVLLRDYLYGGGRTGQRRKKPQFCACVQPSTVED